MSQFTDLGSERAIVGLVVEAQFWKIPTEALVEPEAFHDPLCKLIYRAARAVDAKGQEVCLGSVNKWLETSGAWREVQRALDLAKCVDWLCWSQGADISLAYGEPPFAAIRWALSEIHHYYIAREGVRIGSELSSGLITLPVASKALAELQANGVGQFTSECLLDYYTKAPNPEDCLLGNRFLCRRGGMLFVGPSGMGKSSASVQQDIQWSMGWVSFGIKPARPLKIVTIQAEDDEGDIHEMVMGVAKFLKLTEEQIAAFRKNCIIIPHKSSTGAEFIAFVRRVLEKHRPDILRINPLQAYIGADLKEARVTAEFLRTGINPLMEEFNCAVIIVHHTPKTNFRDTEEWKASDWMYAGAGSADITNWARAILIADPTDNPFVFKWIAAKRGKRIGWATDIGEPTIIRHFSHSSNGGIHWDDTHEADVPQEKKKGGSKQKFTESHILDQMHLVETRKVTDIRKRSMENTGMSKATFFALWDVLKTSEKLIETPQGWRKIL